MLVFLSLYYLSCCYFFAMSFANCINDAIIFPKATDKIIKFKPYFSFTLLEKIAVPLSASANETARQPTKIPCVSPIISWNPCTILGAKGRLIENIQNKFHHAPQKTIALSYALTCFAVLEVSAILVTTPVDVINAKTAPEMTAPPPKAISAKIIYFNIIIFPFNSCLNVNFIAII